MKDTWTITAPDTPLEARWVDVFQADIRQDEHFERQIFLRELLIVAALFFLFFVRRLFI